MDEVQYIANPTLRNPVLVAGFGGWGNAGEIATSTVTYLVERLGAEEFATLSADEFQLFSVHRPLATISKGHLESIDLPTSRFHLWNNPQGQDLILFKGPEPQIRWERYVRALLELCHRHHATGLISLGGLHDDVLHTEEKISAAGASMEDIQRLRQLAEPVELIDYIGPTAIHSLLLAAAREYGMLGISFWGHCASYIQGTNYKLCAAMIRRLSLLLNFHLDTSELELSWRLLEKQIESLIGSNAELKRHIHRLKQQERHRPFKPKAPSSGDKVIHLDRIPRKKDPES